MTLKSAKTSWDYLREEYFGDERIQSMWRMKEYETIKESSDKLLGIANKIRLLGSDFVDSRIIEKNSSNRAREKSYMPYRHKSSEG
ncbi:hypothetical protein CR513_45313, partial [Mucuna pruriens]